MPPRLPNWQESPREIISHLREKENSAGEYNNSGQWSVVSGQ
jgi:hypothetical protein